MPKSRNRKNHKKKVAARRERIEQKRRAFRKKVEAQYGEEIAKQIAEEQKRSGEEPENV